MPRWPRLHPDKLGGHDAQQLAHRGIRAAALVFLAFAAALSSAGCGKDGGGGPTDPAPTDPGPSDPGPSDPHPASWPGPAPVGDVIYAVDLGNNFLVFGSESFDVLTAKMRITGLPILKRIIGIAFRPSNGALYRRRERQPGVHHRPADCRGHPREQHPVLAQDLGFLRHPLRDGPGAQRRPGPAHRRRIGRQLVHQSRRRHGHDSGRQLAMGREPQLEGQTPRLLGMYYSPPPAGSVEPCARTWPTASTRTRRS